jgi:hypothetical protein
VYNKIILYCTILHSTFNTFHLVCTAFNINYFLTFFSFIIILLLFRLFFHIGPTNLHAYLWTCWQYSTSTVHCRDLYSTRRWHGMAWHDAHNNNKKNVLLRIWIYLILLILIFPSTTVLRFRHTYNTVHTVQYNIPSQIPFLSCQPFF